MARWVQIYRSDTNHSYVNLDLVHSASVISAYTVPSQFTIELYSGTNTSSSYGTVLSLFPTATEANEALRRLLGGESIAIF